MRKANTRASALVIVAHPDDETIWMGATIMQYPHFDWTILALCRAQDRDRAPKFRKVCARYGAQALIADADDDGRVSYRQSIPEIEAVIRRTVGDRRFKYVFTHGRNGEYGHYKHKACHEAVRRLRARGQLHADQVYAFHYRKESYRVRFSGMIAKHKPDLAVEFPARLFARKKRIMTELYGFDPEGPDVGYCTNPECFKIMK